MKLSKFIQLMQHQIDVNKLQPDSDIQILDENNSYMSIVGFKYENKILLISGDY